VNSSNRGLVLVYAAALVIFGGVIGYTIKSASAVNPQSLRLGREEEIAAMIMDRLDAKLALTPEQKTQISPLAKKTAQEMEASHLGCLKQVNLMLDKFHGDISPVLTAEQRNKLVDLESERADRMWEKYHYRAPATNAAAH